MAFEPLKRLADKAVPIYVVSGNHERSGIPYELLAKHPNISLFDRPRTYRLQVDGLTIALAGLPFVRNGVRGAFSSLLEETGWRSVRADARLLCLHQSIEGAVVGPADYVFRYDKDTIRASDIPHGFAAVLSGHIHRHQILRRDLKGKPLPAPVFYPGSVERTSFAEKNERKGYLTLVIETDRLRKAHLHGWKFHELPARPMVQVVLDAHRMGPNFESSLKKALERLPPDGVVSLKIRGRLTKTELDVLSAPSLRSIAPPTMNVSVVFKDQTQRRKGARRERAARNEIDGIDKRRRLM
jgi:DNA repair exonuclease SbcCD nuclease subunit